MLQRKGIILAGGSGTRLYPVTRGTSKQLLPLYDKPMIYYPLSVLMLAGVREIAIITTPLDRPAFERLLGIGGQWGLNFTFIEQPTPDGLAQAYLLAEEFLAGSPSIMVLGDNIFYGHGFVDVLARASMHADCATVFGYEVADPRAYGVVECDEAGRVLSIEEKPQAPRSNLALTGLYFFDHRAPSLARAIRPSMRGELEITSLMEFYRQEGSLRVDILGRGFAWLDTGTHDSLLQAAEFVRTIEHRQGLKIACIEEIAFRLGYIDGSAMEYLADDMGKSSYGEYLRKILADESCRSRRRQSMNAASIELEEQRSFAIVNR